MNEGWLISGSPSSTPCARSHVLLLLPSQGISLAACQTPISLTRLLGWTNACTERGPVYDTPYLADHKLVQNVFIASLNMETLSLVENAYPLWNQMNYIVSFNTVEHSSEMTEDSSFDEKYI